MHIILVKCMDTMDVATLTLSSRLDVECKGSRGQESVFRNETHFHKWGKVQRMEPNDSQMHSHFGSYNRARVTSVQNLG